MKNRFYFCVTVAALAFASCLSPAHAAPAKSAAVTNAIPRSVFTMPANKKEGCDPFYPTSQRLWGVTMEAQPSAAKEVKPSGLDCLVLKGLSGVPSNPLAMINGRTMGRGEDAEIITDCGRLLVHCVDITTNSAIIEVAGQRKELRLRSDF